MKGTTKRIINFRFDRYEDTENKLKKLAAKGLFLEECGSLLWTFRKGEPKKLKYTVTYFSEGSVFNPDITDNQQTYFDYAKAAGWNFVTQLNQMQIFCSEADNPIPFETDEKEKFNNIKRCMKKSFIPSMFMIILIFILNMFLQFNSFQRDPIDFLSDTSRLFSVSMMLVGTIYLMYSLLDYFAWCKRSERSIANGGGCAESNNTIHKIVDTLFMIFIFGFAGYILFHIAFETGWIILLFIAQMPILTFVFLTSIKYLKRKKVSAVKNKVISVTLLTIVTFAYIAFIMIFVMKFGFNTDNGSDYRTVSWPVNAAHNREYKLYNDDIPLTCEDLYGEIDYDYYSYEEKKDSTLFLSKSVYRQDSLPAKNSPPEIEYEILETQFDFIYQLSKEHLLKIPEWRDNTGFESVDNEAFGTKEAYQRYYVDNPTGEYILLFDNKIIVLNMEKPVTAEQVKIIKEKLQI
ncbi:DUF2812 domain-containing protein [Sedimentibacter hydroxybenzoicus DSM 7310]|uniref:DUF2812 domain-containing protein n=1 Tax=Sedimentibacter hydroxybenzoicus DSM 7310 TaxID=1123245 RepID=A0A974GXD9_SEDHY|nr:DUF2812 domain-containing protein [Sedimentibacter hydroxybenzoicus]NYB75111.1 DUF2812 domain-containing protein [Sedimentibacter hydroxybenzoicus DSM 7310]